MDANGGTLSLGTIVTSYSKLIIEDYQRAYTWGKEEIEDLFADLWECMREGSDHFFGTLILQKDAELPYVKVVDGQQRLTTTFILVATLRDELAKIDNPVISGGENRVAVFVPQKAYEYLLVDGNFNKFRLHPNRTIHELMVECVLPAPSSDRRSIPGRDAALTLPFRKAVNLIRAKVSKDLTEKCDTDADRLSRINDYLDALLKRFHVLRVLTSDDAESLDIFLTLNNRGMPLGPSDLVRGELLKRLGHGLAGSRLSDLHKRNLDDWQNVVEEVQEPEVFLRHFMVSYQPESVQKKKVVQKVLAKVKDKNGDAERERQNSAEFWSDLIRASEIYAQTLNTHIDQPDRSKFDKSTRLYLELLNGLMKTHRIFLLNFLKHHQGPNDPIREEVLRLLCVYAFRYVMNGANAQQLEDQFQEWGREYDQTRDSDLLRGHLLEGIGKQDVNAERYFAVEADQDYISRALLFAVNYHLSVRHWPMKSYHLEHIAPQTQTDRWALEFLGQDNPHELDWADEVSKLGNLTLLDPEINWKIRNWPFEDKQAEYQKGSTKITDDLLPANLRALHDPLPNNIWHVDDVTLRTSWLLESFELLFSAEKPERGAIKSFTTWKAGLN